MTLDARAAGAASLRKVRVFVSFDPEHDGRLYELLLEQSRLPSSGFTVTGGPERSVGADIGGERVRRRIREADQVIVICSEHTGSSTRVTSELLIAQEEGVPYFLLWGRREVMCTKPVGAKPSEGMYNWTRQILHDQISLTHRKAEADAEAESLRGAQHRR
jgi:hypothetical protein